LDIKTALNFRFRPEQIARFGNNFIVYPSLSKNAYQRIIKERMSKVVQEFNNYLSAYNITINVDESIESMLYHNGVYPVQGARPILSTIDSFINKVVPEAIMNIFSSSNTGTVTLSSETNYEVKVTSDSLTFFIPFTGELDAIRKEHGEKQNISTLFAVHEAGHIVMHSLLYGTCPSMAKINLASANGGGVVAKDHTDITIVDMLKEVKVLFGGRLAEELVFGKGLVSLGASQDLEAATSLLSGRSQNIGSITSKRFVCNW
jgi:cell division protease FtsH